MTNRVGQHLGNYQLIELLGQGHWASLYLGQHLHLHSQAAIKVLHGPVTTSEAEGFLSEARTLACLRHPHIVRVLDFGVQEDTPFLVMEYAPGGTLRQLHPKGARLPLETVVSYVKQVASALQYAHEQRLIHRDLKPENLLLGPEQQVWLSDFGLAIVAHSIRSQPFQQTAGSLAYMAPEQLEGHPTPASDQYALGVMGYEWLCGERPFSGSLPELAVKQTLAPPPPLSEKVPTLPTGVEQVVLQALAKDPKQRFASVQAFALALEEAWRGDTSGQTLPILAPADATKADQEVVSRRDLPKGTVTLLFTDMEGSTQLLQQLGERYADVLSECRQLLCAAFHMYRGYEVDTQGDAFFVAFARATDALWATVAAQRALASHTFPQGVAVRVRMGLHTGEPQRSSQGYVGLDVHHAARIMSAGHGGQVLLSQTTYGLVEHDLPEGVSLRDLGEHRLKDLQRPSHFFQLVIAGLPADFPPLETLDTYPHNLPVQLTPLIGREQEVAAVQNFLQRETVRLVTLIGPGGAGKTRLGLQIAAELSDSFAHGIFFVNLAPISDPALVVPTIAHTLGLRDATDWPLLKHLQAYLRGKHLLLLLDNFEQVVSAAPVLSELLTVCPELRILVTSRAILHIRGEYVFPVQPLTLPNPKPLSDGEDLLQYAAVKLFIHRAQAIKPDFQVTKTNADAIVKICAHLDGLPLAIELAAARIKLLPPQALLARLGRRLHVLTSASQDVPARQQTLWSTLKWSYDLLNAQEQQLFRRLSVFVDGCTLEAAEVVCSTFRDGPDGMAFPVLDVVTSLMDKSLLQQTEQEGEEPRLVMLETIREYAWDCLQHNGEMETIRQAHAKYYLALAEEAEPKLLSAEQLEWLARLERERANLRAAFNWLLESGEIELALRLCGALWFFWFANSLFCFTNFHLSEGQSWLEKSLATANGVATSVGIRTRAKALFAAAGIAYYQGDYSLSSTLFEKCLKWYRELGDMWGIAVSLNALGHICLGKGDYATVRTTCEESLPLLRQVGDRWHLGEALFLLAYGYHAGSDTAKAHSMGEECLAISREIGDRQALIRTLQALGYFAYAQGDLATAFKRYKEGLMISKEARSKPLMASCLVGLGGVAAAQGQFRYAVCLWGAARARCYQHDEMAPSADFIISGWLAEVVCIQVRYQRLLALARSQLGEQTFMATWNEGQEMTIEEVLATCESIPLSTGTVYEYTEPTVAQSSPLSSLVALTNLTPREVEVLRLLAKGLANAQIAEALVVSLLTVKAHLRSIYSKLGVTSRSAATRYALEHHLS